MMLARLLFSLLLSVWVLCNARLLCQEPGPISLQCAELTESSGLAFSRLNPQIVWTHNDSGDSPRLFAFTLEGVWLAELRLDGVKAIDWEDMCSFRREGKSYLAIGDIGDNSKSRSMVNVYVVEEPQLEVAARATKQLVATEFTRIAVTYADGPVNCESLAYDSKNDQFILATKEAFRCRLYQLPAQPSAQVSAVVAKATQTIGLPMTTGADISADGQKLVICTYGPACLFGKNSQGNWDLKETSIQTIGLPVRKQGESICFDEAAQELWGTSEFSPTPLWHIALPTH